MFRERLFLIFAIGCTCSASCRDVNRAQTEPEGQYVVVNGHRLWYHIEGEGSPLLLIPGGPGASHTYLWPHFNSLAADFRVIYFDPYGRGRSERAANQSEYTFAREVKEIEALRLALGLETINIYGHSYGGLVAQGYAEKYEPSLDHLFLANAFPSGEMWQNGLDRLNFELQNQMPELWDGLQSLRSKGHLSCDAEYQKALAAMPLALAYLYDPSNADHFDDGAVDINVDVYCQLAGPDSEIVLGEELASLDFRPWLKRTRVPTLILAGRFDRIASPKLVLPFKTFMPHATLTMFERSGHSPFAEEPEAHAAAIRTFVKAAAK